MINPFKKSYTHSELSMFRFLSKVKIFEDLDYEEMSWFIPLMHEREYKRDEVVFFRGDPSQALYIVKKGKVLLNIDIEDRFESLAEADTNTAFGDNSLLKEADRVYTAVAASKSVELFVIPRVNILEVFEKDVKIKAKMLNSLADLYNQYNVNLFKSYRSAFGFFELGMVYRDPQ